MSETTENPNVLLLRENTLWQDVKGRTLLIMRRWHAWGGKQWELSDVDIFILEERSLVKRPYNELVALISDGRMKYTGVAQDFRGTA